MPQKVQKPCQLPFFLNFSWAEILSMIKHHFKKTLQLTEVKNMESFLFYNFPKFRTLENKKKYFPSPEKFEIFFGHRLHFY